MKYIKYILVLSLLLMTSCKRQEEVKINSYDGNQLCTLQYEEVIDDNLVNSQSNIYVFYNEDKMVEKAIYQSISDNDYIDDNLYANIINLYNSIKGIKAHKYMVDDKIVFEITYDYLDIDLDEVSEKLGELLEDKTLLRVVDKLPVSYDEFKDIELQEYDCK